MGQNLLSLVEKEKHDYHERGDLFLWHNDIYILTVVPQHTYPYELSVGENSPTFEPWLVCLIDIDTGNRLNSPVVKMVRGSSHGDYHSLDESCLFVKKTSPVFLNDGLVKLDKEMKSTLLKSFALINNL